MKLNSFNIMVGHILYSWGEGVAKVMSHDNHIRQCNNNNSDLDVLTVINNSI